MFMKRLFSFNAKQECSTLLVVISKVVKVIYIVLACVAALIMLIGGIQVIQYSSLNFLLALVLGAAAFFLLLFMGFVLEILFLSFSIVTRKSYEDLLERGKIDDLPLSAGKKNAIGEKLHALNELKNNGIISEEEFNEKKKEWLQEL